MRKKRYFQKKLLDDVHFVLQCVATMVKQALFTDMILRGSACLAMLSFPLGASSWVDGQLDMCAGEMVAMLNVFY